jgi:hypothetical protein
MSGATQVETGQTLALHAGSRSGGGVLISIKGHVVAGDRDHRVGLVDHEVPSRLIAQRVVIVAVVRHEVCRHWIGRRIGLRSGTAG